MSLIYCFQSNCNTFLFFFVLKKGRGTWSELHRYQIYSYIHCLIKPQAGFCNELVHGYCRCASTLCTCMDSDLIPFFHMRYSSVSRSTYAYVWFLMVHSYIYIFIDTSMLINIISFTSACRLRWLKYCRYGVKHQSISQFTRHTSTDSFLIKSWCRSRNRSRIAEYQSVYIYVRYSLVFHTSYYFIKT